MWERFSTAKSNPAAAPLIRDASRSRFHLSLPNDKLGLVYNQILNLIITDATHLAEIFVRSLWNSALRPCVSIFNIAIRIDKLHMELTR